MSHWFSTADLHTERVWLPRADGAAADPFWLQAGRELVARRRVAIVSSRIGRDLGRCPNWLAALTWIVRRLHRGRDLLLTSRGTTADRFVRRLAARHRLPCINLELPNPRKRTRHPPSAGEADIARWSLRPEVATDERRCADKTSGPLADRGLLAIADLVYVVRIRTGGAIDQLLRQHVRSRPEHQRLAVLVGRDLVQRDLVQRDLVQRDLVQRDLVQRDLVQRDLVQRDLVQRDLVQRELRATAACDATGIARFQPRRPVGGPVPAPVVGAGDLEWPCLAAPPQIRALSDHDSWLTHWTRGRSGPWPGQSELEYLDEVLLKPWQVDHSPLAVLARIIRSRRLAASSSAIRGGAAVVCFTAVAPCQFSGRRTFRRGRTRWDFEPYGICLRREWLENRGARPVRYGDDAVWQSLSADQRPFFQRAKGASVDWRHELEWRHLGDVPLDQLTTADARLFVPDAQSALRLAAVAPWPIFIASGR